MVQLTEVKSRVLNALVGTFGRPGGLTIHLYMS
jgi:hypothetical protein